MMNASFNLICKLVHKFELDARSVRLFVRLRGNDNAHESKSRGSSSYMMLQYKSADVPMVGPVFWYLCAMVLP